MTALSPDTVAALRELLRRPGTRETVAHAIETAGHCEHPGGESCTPWWQADAAIAAILEMAEPVGYVDRHGDHWERDGEYVTRVEEPRVQLLLDVIRDRYGLVPAVSARPFSPRPRAVDGTDPNPKERS